ncbi:uncharacterized protein Z518_10260 [Rhinocladiella mackenziei CBS 650.93]|uniref:Uncharacterized protein n=1 Tax=Rhinocladiella mackenziei CBS 650.93 TaxID=1442369 RepID=A0A0D2GP56_9EURO|nr:uncharacterized protein Z518_10260 [Rhinocladiella mackenziei CBS 650.93]KIX00123.1 hypothetical protein Z518_10260 [Rhinocladiella mackenziei CBS 650.93]
MPSHEGDRGWGGNLWYSRRALRRILNLDLVVYDKNPEVGGTWYENRYPGVACDIPAHVYQASFEPNSNWSQFYASEAEILEYWKGIVAKYDLRRYMKLGHKVVEARFNEAESKWYVKAEDCRTGEVVQNICDPEDKWYDIIQVNLSAAFVLAQAFASDIVKRRAQGKIINTSSVGGFLASKNTVAYTAARHGINALTKSFSTEFAALGINVNAVAPGYTITEMTRKNLENNGEAFLKRIPIG